MFDSLSGKLQNVFRNLRGLGKISESNVADSLREVRMALLDADVNFKVARDFIERVKAKAIGQQVIQSIQPGQQVIKIIHDELVELLGAQNASLVQELVRLRDLVKPQEILLVLDAATGQEAVNVATHFDQALHITGAILTRLDGDARGGAALSLKAVTGKPIKFAGVGEKLEDFEPFHPERMASRILGMGDVVSLVEKAAEAVDMDEARRMEEKMRKGQFTLEDFLDQLRQMKKLGSLESIVGMLPGGGEMLKEANLTQQETEFRRMEGMICAMTPKERRNPQILNARRRQRIAKGSGVPVSELNTLLNRFAQMQQMMKKMGKLQRMMAKMGGPRPGMFGR